MNMIINGMEPNTFFTALFFCFLGFVLHKLLVLMTRDRKSQRTPGKLSGKFWIQDNWVEFLFHLILMFLGVLFTPYFLDQIHGSAYTPAQLKSMLENAPAMLTYTGVGWLIAAPMQAVKKNYKSLVDFLKRKKK